MPTPPTFRSGPHRAGLYAANRDPLVPQRFVPLPGAPHEDVVLVPCGRTQIRIAEFPTIG